MSDIVADATKENFNGLIEIESWIKNKQRHIQIIGFWAQLEKTSLENKEQARNFLNRNLKIAAQLTGYSNERIKKTRDMLKNKDLSYTLETIARHIDATKEMKKEPKRYEEIIINGITKMKPIYE